MIKLLKSAFYFPFAVLQDYVEPTEVVSTT